MLGAGRLVTAVQRTGETTILHVLATFASDHEFPVQRERYQSTLIF